MSQVQMLQFQQHLLRMYFAQMTSCFVHYDVIWYPFPVNSQYLKIRGVDSPAFTWQRTCQLGKLFDEFSPTAPCQFVVA